MPKRHAEAEGGRDERACVRRSLDRWGPSSGRPAKAGHDYCLGSLVTVMSLRTWLSTEYKVNG